MTRVHTLGITQSYQKYETPCAFAVGAHAVRPCEIAASTSCPKLWNPLTWQVNLYRRDIYLAGDPSGLALEAVGFLLFTPAGFALANRALNQPME